MSAKFPCPNCKKLIHRPNPDEDFVICPYCVQSTAPVPHETPNDLPPLVPKISSVQKIALGLLFLVLSILLYLYFMTTGATYAPN